MPSIRERYRSSFLNAQDVENGELVLQIDYIEWDAPISNSKIGDVVHFVNHDKCLILNATNARRIARLHGDDGDKWRGRWITLYYDPEVEFQGEKIPGIRVREQAPPRPTEGNGPLSELPPPREPLSRRDELEDEVPF